jgi:predicted nucleotidyltransferase component of viral defense system
MSNFATLPATERELFFRQYQQSHGVDPIIAEKDFWVCWLLGRIFELPTLAETCLFKGGTSLSKVFHIIDRFSEDIDIGITPVSLGLKESDLDEAPSRTKRDERVARLNTA